VSATELISLVCCDLGAIVRGRSLPAPELGEHLHSGVSWVPANHALTPLGTLAEESPFDSLGDLRLVPDPQTHVRVEPDRQTSALEFVLCDILQTDGEQWDCCPRRFLREALAELRSQLGARLLASFEHEFQLLGTEAAPPAFSLEAQRRSEPFAAAVMAALTQAGVQPERFLCEYAPHQFEVPVAAAEGIAAADRAVVLREVVREVARRHELRVSFAALLDPSWPGNGVHIHLSLLDADGQTLMYDSRRPAGLSELAGRFAAGILRHSSALSALCAPSPVSAERLTPHRWSAGAACLGAANRETLLRIPSPITFAGRQPQTQTHLEYRGADATANPYLALGAIVRAGIQGVREELPAAAILDRDPSALEGAQASSYGVGALPASLEDSLLALQADRTVSGWLAPQLREVYLAIKRTELRAVADLDVDEICRRYAEIY
jgi:glutamine synthetase